VSTLATIAEKVQRLSPWFYEYDLPGGVLTASSLPESVRPIHGTRRQMLRTTIMDHFADRIPEVSALDLGCHEGYFSFMLAEMGIPRILGLDIREENLEKARFIRDVLDHQAVEFQPGDCLQLETEIPETFDLVLCVGLLYHQENPILCLRQAATKTRELLLVETQVIDEIEGETEWGQQNANRSFHGGFALIDETAEFGAGAREAGSAPLALCPSPRALEHILHAVGFPRVERIAPPPEGYEQHVRGKRVVYAAYKPIKKGCSEHV